MLVHLIANLVLADVQFTAPAAGATLYSSQNILVVWKESGGGPPLDSLKTYQLVLCAGGNDESTLVCRTTLTVGVTVHLRTFNLKSCLMTARFN